jgi:hypothetical protein
LLRDQFDELDGQIDLAIVFPPFMFCNPADKLRLDTEEFTERVNPTNHLTFYPMISFPAGPERSVLVSNQFGEQRLRVQRSAFVLGVPTEKNNEGPVKDLDHFKCYLVEGRPVELEVLLFDQFTGPNGAPAKVLQPRLLCNPTLKLHAGNFTPITNEEAHLVCYETNRDANDELISTRNQFATTRLQVGESMSLCVPSKKRIATGPLPDLVIELPDPAVVSCPTGAGSCVQTIRFTVSEIAGVAVTTPFDVEIVNELGQAATVTIPSLPANGSTSGSLTLGLPGANCYNPDCTTNATVDTGDAVMESDEGNNTDTRTDLG